MLRSLVGSEMCIRDRHRACTQPGWGGRLIWSVDCQRALLSGKASGRPVGRPDRESALCIQFDRPGGRPARVSLLSGSGHGRPGDRPLGSTVKFFTVGRSTGRSTGRAIWPFSAANGQISKWAINTPFELVFQKEFLEQKFFIFQQAFKRVLVPKDLIFICFKRVGKFKKRRSLWGVVLIFIYIFNLEFFLSVFPCDFDFQTLLFSHT